MSGNTPIQHFSRYYASLVYILPADEAEKQRLEEQHELIVSVFDNKCILPSINLAEAEVLDIGTGTGAWPLDVLSKYTDAKSAKFICIDLESRLFPTNVPYNMSFRIMSALNMPREWSNRFSLVHQRLLLAGLKYNEWEQVINEIYRVTAPSGWVQLCEVEPTAIFNGPATSKMLALVDRLVQETELDFKCTERIPSFLSQAGFVNVSVDTRHPKYGTWGGELGCRFAETQINAWRGMKTPILHAGGFGTVKSEQEFDELVSQVQIEWDTHSGPRAAWITFTAQKKVY